MEVNSMNYQHKIKHDSQRYCLVLPKIDTSFNIICNLFLCYSGTSALSYSSLFSIIFELNSMLKICTRYQTFLSNT